ncbi:hypothetical protein Aspvir_009129 [Aspergillus viridinutans]|uniref:FAD-binding FR-type domain-containing protein n=1 Tax=Aspergillus viridinutans TaxID=75553 RepID=A0A9P3BXX3_ASPVI|nr:uncharacterized protein Aspvir_009129 [Aspergillus viridinutans]GIK05030.1 hypothetical protein Aspvir_009129 [Aspergillus viridinutans]
MSVANASLYIQPDEYKIVGKYLLETMKEVLGDACTDDILDARAAAYWALADIMIAREGTLYKESQGWTNWRQFRVATKVRESDEITSFYLMPLDGKPLPNFKPGQYISVRVDVPRLKYPQARQYSLSDAPRSDYYRISVKKESGLNPRAPGAKRHPGYVSTSCTMSPRKATSLKSLTARKLLPFHSQARAFKDRIQALGKKFPNMQVTFFTSTPSERDQPGVDYHHLGRIDLQKLDRSADLHLDDSRTEFYICSPQAFMAQMKGSLKARVWAMIASRWSCLALVVCLTTNASRF